MNKRSVLIVLNLLVLTLTLGSIYFFLQLYNKQSKTSISTGSDQYAYLTTTNLRQLDTLPETNQITPTGKTKNFTLQAKETEWEIMPGVKTKAITYNGKTPGPVLRVTEGDLVKITLVNELKTATSIHFHGMHLPNKQDGVPPFTQKEIEPGKSYTYEFLAGHAGTYMYHPHINSVDQIDKGLYGAFIIEPQSNLGQPHYDKEYTFVLAGWNIQSNMSHDMDMTGVEVVDEEESVNTTDDKTGHNMDMSGVEMVEEPSMAMDYNYWTINGKSFPATEKIKVKQGQRIRVRLINISNAAHPMHLHGTDFRIIAEDSHPLSKPKIVNTVDIAPGKTFDIDFIADNLGQWVFHCHELHHTENDGVEPGGLMTVIEVEGTQSSNKNTSIEQKHKSEDSSEQNMDMSNHSKMPGM